MADIFTPVPWQAHMLAHLYKYPRCALFAEMGMGKTAVVLSFLATRYHLNPKEPPTLILGPLRVARSVWSNEAKKWQHLSHLRVVPLVGTQPQRTKLLDTPAEIYTINYESVPWLVKHFGPRWPFKTIVADESDHLKSQRVSFQTSKTGKEYLRVNGGERASSVAQVAFTYASRFIALTGTPAPNGLKDLWGQVWFLDRGHRLGNSFDAFSQRWFRRSYNNFGIEPLPHASVQIHAAIQDICLSVRVSDWLDLAAPIKVNVYVDLPDHVVDLYQKMETELFIQISEMTSAEAANAAAKTSKCLQIANGAIYTDIPEGATVPTTRDYEELHDEKIQALESIASEAGENALMVCYEFQSDLARLKKAFPKARQLSTQKDEDDFKAGKFKMLLLHPKSGGHGIDGFQYVCHRIVFFGHNWNLGTYMQVIERIGPIRQKTAGVHRPVFVYHIIARDTIDELVMERRESKREVQDILLDACSKHQNGTV